MDADQLEIAGRPPSLAPPRRLSPYRARGRLAARMDAGQRAALGAAWRALLLSRVLVWAAGIAAVLIWGSTAHPNSFDPSGLTHGLGPVGDVLGAPANRWDGAWYLSIAHGGYAEHAIGGADGRAAFFPLYPLLVRAVAMAGPGPVEAGVAVSLVALLAALYLTHRLATLELGHGGPEAPRLAVLATALFPMALFFSADYSESLYLALSLGVFWQARRGHWALAGLLGALASATRSIGVLLVIPLLVLYLYGPRAERRAGSRGARPDAGGPGASEGDEGIPETNAGGGGAQAGGPRGHRGRAAAHLGALLGRVIPRHRPGLDVLWIALVPAGLAAFLGYLALQGGDALAPFRVQEVWFRHFAGPFGGVRDGVVAAWEGGRQLLSGSRAPVYFTAAGGDSFVVAEHNLELLAFLVAGVVAVAGVLRRLPAAYGAYVVVALALPLSYPVTPQPLMSLPRFMAVLFPIHLWTGRWLAGRPRARRPVLGLYAIALVVSTAQFATWHWVA